MNCLNRSSSGVMKVCSRFGAGGCRMKKPLGSSPTHAFRSSPFSLVSNASRSWKITKDSGLILENSCRS